MPIHLTSRRSFLKSALGAGCGWLLGGCASTKPAWQTGPARDGSVQWAFMADTHIHGDINHSMYGGRMSDWFRLVFADILATETPMAGVVIDGDLAFNSGLSADYATMAGLLEPARLADLDVHLILGNHDDRGNMLRTLLGGNSPGPLAPNHHVGVADSGAVRMIMLDSLIRPNYSPGRLGPEQLAWLAQTLDAEPSRPTILFLHHFLRGDGRALQDEAQLVKVIAPRRQVKAVFAGHSHEYRFRESRGIHFVELPATGYRFSMSEPLGWLRARLDSRGCELELRMVEGDREWHGQRRQLTWRPLGAG